MKKILVAIFCFFLLSINVYAADISSVNTSGDKEKKIGEEGAFNLTVGFSGLEKGYDKTLGVWMIGIELKADDAIKLTSVSAADFDSVFTYDEEENSYYILSVVSDDATTSNLCANGNLYCSTYTVKVSYIIKDTSKTSASVTVSEVDAELLDMVEEREYTLNDAIELEVFDSGKYTVSIKQQTSTSTTTSNSNSNKTTNSNTNTTQTASTSENKYLKSLEIEGVELDFDKETTDYTISVSQGVNSLNIKATTEDKNATYQIIGADNLSENKSLVRIEVTAQDKTKLTYYIRVRYDKDDNTEETVIDGEEEKNTSTKDKKVEVNGNILKWIGIGIGVLVGIGLIVFIISKIKDRSIDKKLESLDDD